MGIASSIRELAKDIASSHGDRTKAVLEIKEEANRVSEDARDLIKGFQASRKNESAQLRKDLVRGKAERRSEVKKTLTSLQDSRQEESARMRKELAQGAADRRSAVGGILKEAQDIEEGFRSDRKQMGSQLRKELAQSKANNRSEVAGMLKGIRNSRREEGTQMRKELAQTAAGRRSNVGEILRDFRQAQAEVGADLEEAKVAWQDLAKTMQAKRAGATPKVKPPVAKKEKVEVPAAAAEQRPDLPTQLLSAIKAHPQGITLAEATDSIGVASIVLGHAVRRLLDEGKVRKEEKSYFPVAGR